MKDRILSLCTMLLIVWYCFSIIGFNVHTCNASGRSFIATFISGLDCSDIHPEHHHDHACCCHHSDACDCHHHDQCTIKSADCCSDDHMSLDITGTVFSDEQQDFDFQESDLYAYADMFGSGRLQNAYQKVSHESGTSVLIVPRDCQSLLNIWRI